MAPLQLVTVGGAWEFWDPHLILSWQVHGLCRLCVACGVLANVQTQPTELAEIPQQTSQHCGTSQMAIKRDSASSFGSHDIYTSKVEVLSCFPSLETVIAFRSPRLASRSRCDPKAPDLLGSPLAETFVESVGMGQTLLDLTITLW